MRAKLFAFALDVVAAAVGATVMYAIDWWNPPAPAPLPQLPIYFGVMLVGIWCRRILR